MLEKTLKNIYKIFIAATEEKSREALIFQMPQYKRGWCDSMQSCGSTRSWKITFYYIPSVITTMSWRY